MMAGTNRDQDSSDAAAALGEEPDSESTGLPPEVTGHGNSTVTAASSDIQSYIASQLRAVFENVAKQPIPDRFLDLMKQLD